MQMIEAAVFIPSHFPDEADLPLLRQMAIQTDGLFTLLDQPGDLIPVMLDALELALRSQQLPIRNREIQIDSDIRQIRLTRLGERYTGITSLERDDDRRQY